MEGREGPSERRKKPNVTIREMDIDDIAGVFHLGETLFSARDVPNLYRTWDEYEVIELYNSDTEFCLVAEVDDDIVGFALGTTITKSRSPWKYGQLAWLGVHPGYQRWGIATRLFNEFKELMLESGVRILLVDTEADNTPALEFFREAGFGQPEEHIYLTLNITNHHRNAKKKRGKARAKNGANDD
jgi:ribosomal protein S18 acetylase RimI-like enzyme